ncbi:hypothetical protein ASG90_02305 [Nocardioides sp. Soil797]|nr:hypothetical protein ASG90_02305 [Nocardioides sp. Soil797]
MLATDKTWCLTVWPSLNDGKGFAQRVEEELVNAFAAAILIDAQTADDAFMSGVTSQSLVQLYDATNASATACLVRGLREPGHRLVMLCSRDGLTLFAASNGEPFNPGNGVMQPAVARAVERMDVTDGTNRFDGGEGVHYRSGKTYTRVRFDVTARGGLVFVVVEPAALDTRVAGSSEWSLDCPACGQNFTQDLSPGLCSNCHEPLCPRCGGCDCEVAAAITCERCFIVLPKNRSSAGLRYCEDCE